MASLLTLYGLNHETKICLHFLSFLTSRWCFFPQRQDSRCVIARSRRSMPRLLTAWWCKAWGQLQLGIKDWSNRSISQIPQYVRQGSHDAHFCYKMLHCNLYDTGALWDLWIRSFLWNIQASVQEGAEVDLSDRLQTMFSNAQGSVYLTAWCPRASINSCLASGFGKSFISNHIESVLKNAISWKLVKWKFFDMWSPEAFSWKESIAWTFRFHWT